MLCKEGCGKGASKVCCLVPNCRREVPLHKPYLKRHKICSYHSQAVAVELQGKEWRWCQQCARFQPTSEFEGERRSCREQLLRHQARRRKRREEDSLGISLSRRRRTGARRAAVEAATSSDPGPSAGSEASAQTLAASWERPGKGRAAAASPCSTPLSRQPDLQQQPEPAATAGACSAGTGAAESTRAQAPLPLPLPLPGQEELLSVSDMQELLGDDLLPDLHDDLAAAWQPHLPPLQQPHHVLPASSLGGVGLWKGGSWQLPPLQPGSEAGSSTLPWPGATGPRLQALEGSSASAESSTCQSFAAAPLTAVAGGSTAYCALPPLHRQQQPGDRLPEAGPFPGTRGWQQSEVAQSRPASVLASGLPGLHAGLAAHANNIFAEETATQLSLQLFQVPAEQLPGALRDAISAFALNPGMV